jgi:hypothetical protein
MAELRPARLRQTHLEIMLHHGDTEGTEGDEACDLDVVG